MGIIDDTDIARRGAEGEQPIIEQIRELVGEPNASVTIVLDEDVWGFDNHEDNANYNAEMLTEAKLDWEGIEMADRDRGIGWLHGPGIYVHLGDQLLRSADYDDQEELQRLLDMLNNPE